MSISLDDSVEKWKKACEEDKSHGSVFGMITVGLNPKFVSYLVFRQYHLSCYWIKMVILFQEYP